MTDNFLPLLLTAWLLPCALQDYRTRAISNWLTIPPFLLAWPIAYATGHLPVAITVFLGCYAAWYLGFMGAADGKIATVLAAAMPAALAVSGLLLVLMFSVGWAWKRRSVRVPGAVAFYGGVVLLIGYSLLT